LPTIVYDYLIALTCTVEDISVIVAL